MIFSVGVMWLWYLCIFQMKTAQTRMNSSRMRTVHCSGRHGGGGGCLPKGYLPGVRSRGCLYTGVYIPFPCGQNDWQTGVKTATSFAGGNYWCCHFIQKLMKFLLGAYESKTKRFASFKLSLKLYRKRFINIGSKFIKLFTTNKCVNISNRLYLCFCTPMFSFVF